MCRLGTWTWTSICHMSLSHPLLWPWAQRWLFKEEPRFFTANKCINIFSYLALSGGRKVQEVWQRICRWYHLPWILCIFLSAGSEVCDQSKNFSISSTIELSLSCCFPFLCYNRKISQLKEFLFSQYIRIHGVSKVKEISKLCQELKKLLPELCDVQFCPVNIKRP